MSPSGVFGNVSLYFCNGSVDIAEPVSNSKLPLGSHY